MSKKALSSSEVKSSRKKLILKYKLRRETNLQWLGFVFILLVFAVVLWTTRAYTAINLKDGIETLVAVTVTVIAYIQWRLARHEISIDKYYDRLDNANNRLEKLPDVDVVALHVFAEMDKLEYVLMKYKIGFMPVELVLRAIENFRSLCRYRNNFHSCASNYIAKSAYLPETSKLVLVILDEVLPAPDTSENCKDVDEKNF